MSSCCFLPAEKNDFAVEVIFTVELGNIRGQAIMEQE